MLKKIKKHNASYQVGW